MIAQLMKIHGAKIVVVSDIAEGNLAVAKAVGVDHAVRVGQNARGLLDLVMKVTGGRGVQRVFNTVGSGESILESLRMLANGGVAVLMATKDKEFTLPSLLISGERTVKTSTNALLSDFPKALELLEAGMLNLDPLVTHRFPLSRATEAFAVACDKVKHDAVKIIVDCQS